jgi:DNA-binding transcriptional MerR regulator/methylmalonyl-CoA mutase cobalamin-binding subunit
MSDAPNRQARYPLRAVMRRTGLSADVIRAWERRYAAVDPPRSPGGQRLYSEQDVVRLGLLRRATASGHSIGEIARLDIAALEALLQRSGDRSGESTTPAATVVAAALGATERLDSVALESVLKRATLSLGVDRFVDTVVSHFLTEVGTRWHVGTLSPAHEHLASDTVRRVLAWVSQAYEVEPNAPRIVVATPAGEMHELGAMAAAAAAVSEGWRGVYRGANLPGRDIARAAEQVGARVVALSVVYPDDGATVSEIVEAARSLPQGATLVIGGSGASVIEDAILPEGVRVLGDIGSLRRMLRAAGSSGDHVVGEVAR